MEPSARLRASFDALWRNAGGLPRISLSLHPGYSLASIKLVVQSELGRVHAVEGVIPAKRRSRGGAAASSAHSVALVQIQEQILHLHRPFAGEGPFDAAARHQERARVAVAGVEQAGATEARIACVGDGLFQSRKANARFAIEQSAPRHPAGAARNGAIPVADHGLVEGVVVVTGAVGVGRGCAEAQIAGLGFSAEYD